MEIETFNLDNLEKPQYYGSFKVIKNNEIDILPVKTVRVHFHSDGYLITESENQEFNDLKITGHIGNPGFIINETNMLIKFSETDSSAQLTWKTKGIDHKIELYRIDLKSLPIAQDEFHLTMESY